MDRLNQPQIGGDRHFQVCDLAFDIHHRLIESGNQLGIVGRVPLDRGVRSPENRGNKALWCLDGDEIVTVDRSHHSLSLNPFRGVANGVARNHTGDISLPEPGQHPLGQRRCGKGPGGIVNEDVLHAVGNLRQTGCHRIPPPLTGVDGPVHGPDDNDGGNTALDEGTTSPFPQRLTA
ncbi:MAG: hypothetical protein KJN73_07865 [Acidimicrobiia bacterium]|nr:hypothetical protein [Acidimicrobiia bacterium]